VQNKISEIISQEDFKVDELGRVVIQNNALLENLRGAVAELGQEGLGDTSGCNDSNCG
jgi:hypothetical protein